MIKITFACGHTVPVASEGAAPICPLDGEHRIRHVAAPPPTFRGQATGPYVETLALPAIPVSLREKERP